MHYQDSLSILPDVSLNMACRFDPLHIEIRLLGSVEEVRYPRTPKDFEIRDITLSSSSSKRNGYIHPDEN